MFSCSRSATVIKLRAQSSRSPRTSLRLQHDAIHRSPPAAQHLAPPGECHRWHSFLVTLGARQRPPWIMSDPALSNVLTGSLKIKGGIKKKCVPSALPPFVQLQSFGAVLGDWSRPARATTGRRRARRKRRRRSARIRRRPAMNSLQRRGPQRRATAKSHARCVETRPGHPVHTADRL